LKGSWLIFVAVVAAALTVVVAASAAPERDFRLRSLGGSRVIGEGTFTSLGAETGLRVVIEHLKPGKKFRLMLNIGTCARRTAGINIGEGKARQDGTSYTSSLVRRNGAPIRFKTVTDGKHVIAVIVGTRAVACGPIPA
jgi:hypothetical protein